jgi:hypothetical protein
MKNPIFYAQSYQIVTVRTKQSSYYSEIRVEKTHTTHVNIIELILFWYNKLDCIFWLYFSVYIDLLHEK